MKNRSVPCSERQGWHMLHDKKCLWFEGELPPIQPLPLQGPDGKSWPPGSKFIFLGGHKSSAGFEWLSFKGLSPIEYLGQMSDENPDDTPGMLAVFQQSGTPCRFGWHVLGETLHWGTNSLTSRVIELARATLEGEEIPPQEKGKKKRRADTGWPSWVECRDCWEVTRWEHTPEKCKCEKCGSEAVTIWSSRSKAQRPVFDELQRTYGATASEIIQPIYP